MNLDAIRGALNDLRHCELQLCQKMAERDYLLKNLAFHMGLADGDLSEPVTPDLRSQVYRQVKQFTEQRRTIGAIAPDNNEAPISLFGGKGAS